MKYDKVLIGLDLGTDSVGWCVTDQNGQIIKKNGKSLWGYLGFNEANSCAERRSYRSQRRRYNRRQERIKLLRDIFNDEINKVDSSFYYRLDHSFYHKEDREQSFDYTLFNSLQYTDKQYYEKYPTIYHLRKHLIESNEKEDIRLVYLAMHHMIKYRGNFLSNIQEYKPLDENEGFALFTKLFELLKTNDDVEMDKEYVFQQEQLDNLKKASTEIRGLTALKEEFNSIINKEKNKHLKDVIIPLMVGASVNINKIKVENIDTIESKNLCVKDEKFDDIISQLLNADSSKEEYIEALICCKEIYEYFLVGKLLGKNKFLSDAMVARYNNHKKQLDALKKYIKKNIPEKYDEVFRIYDEKVCNYAFYIGSTLVNNAKQTKNHASQEDFYKYLKTILKEYENDEFVKQIYESMSNGEYLQRQNATDNGVFPYQLNKMEMKIILEKQSKFYPFLLNKDGEFSNINKIMSILEYKIPYYYGPLISPLDGNDRSKFSWIVKTNEKIYPWNIDKVVNKDETAKAFITRMLSKCTYLPSCYCLPKNSLLFSYFNVLNHLNCIHINGESIKPELKMEIINELYKNNRKVTKKMLLDFLTNKTGSGDVEIASSNNKEVSDFDFDMASYVDFKNILGEDYVNQHKGLIENIIRDIVIFEDKSILASRLKNIYGIQHDEIIKKIKSLNYSKYATLSKELLVDIRYINSDEHNGEVTENVNIIKLLEQTEMNLQQVLYDEKYRFIDLILEYNKKHSNANEYESIEEYVNSLSYVSPGMKRPMIQAYKICEEVEKILGQRIDEYYVECTRTNKAEKKRTDSRQKKLLDLYSEAIKDVKDEILKNELKEKRDIIQQTDINKFRSDKYYLYFSQFGRCMYTGRPIDIGELNDDAHYNIDHIYPQSLIKDDSLTNRVLVETKANEDKGDQYPIPHSVLWNGNNKEAHKFFKLLKDCKMISEEKYKRLTTLQLTTTELESFVNRQLVYTNQAVKGFINAIRCLKTTDDFEPKIVYAKGENVSDFRKKYDIVKCRTANNFHHAHDAYLNIIVGRTIEEYFSYYQNTYGRTSYLQWMKDHNVTMNVMKIFDQNKEGTKKDIIKNNSIIWSYDNSLREIKHNIYERFDIFSNIRVYCDNSLIRQITRLKAGKGKVPLCMKNPLNNIAKYGGYNSYAFGSFCLVKTPKGYYMEPIPSAYKNDLNDYLKSIYSSFEIVVPCLKKHTIIYKGKLKYAVKSCADENRLLIENRYEKIFSPKELSLIKKIEKYQDMKLKKGLEDLLHSNDDKIVLSPAKNNSIKEISVSKEDLLSFYHDYMQILKKDIYAYKETQTLLNYMVENEKRFVSLKVCSMMDVLIQCIEFLKCNNGGEALDLSLLADKKAACEMRINKKLANCKIVYESITGYYSKVVFKID